MFVSLDLADARIHPLIKFISAAYRRSCCLFYRFTKCSSNITYLSNMFFDVLSSTANPDTYRSIFWMHSFHDTAGQLSPASWWSYLKAFDIHGITSNSILMEGRGCLNLRSQWCRDAEGGDVIAGRAQVEPRTITLTPSFPSPQRDALALLRL